MKKKTFLTLLPIFVVAALCFTLTSCGGGGDDDDSVPSAPANNNGSPNSNGSQGSLGYDSGVAPEGTQAIDLGLPSGTLWANMNVGATTAEGTGLYFAWGETTGYGNNTSDGRLFDWDAYKYGSETYPEIFKYCTNSQIGTVDNKTLLELSDDAARANWKGDWRMPTKNEFQELLDNTTQERITQNGVSGIKLTSKRNGNSLFFPAIGYRLTDRLILYGEGGWYWTSSLEYDDDNKKYDDYSASAFGFAKVDASFYKTYDGRSYGLNVRAVIGKESVTPAGDEAAEPTYPDIQSTPLTLEAISDGTITLKNSATGIVIYKINGGADNTIGAGATIDIPVAAGQKVTLFGDNSRISRISSTCDFYAYGNIMSLVKSTNFSTTTALTVSFTFASLFEGNTHLKSHPSNQLLLPATTLANSCYDSMFKGCTGLTSAPALPATTLEYACYNSMFSGCTGLTTAPALPATTLDGYCYGCMFDQCTSLTIAPELPATTLTGHCYGAMFRGCTSLTSAPALPATILSAYCYSSMFSGCTSLTSVPSLPATTLAESCYSEMFKSCTNITSAPELPATAIAKNCYDYMFYGCSKLKYVKCMSMYIGQGGWTENWLAGVASGGTFVKASGSSWIYGIHGIPYSWTVIEE